MNNYMRAGRRIEWWGWEQRKFLYRSRNGYNFEKHHHIKFCSYCPALHSPQKSLWPPRGFKPKTVLQWGQTAMWPSYCTPTQFILICWGDHNLKENVKTLPHLQVAQWYAYYVEGSLGKTLNLKLVVSLIQALIQTITRSRCVSKL